MISKKKSHPANITHDTSKQIPSGKVAANDEYATRDMITPEHIDITNIAGLIADSIAETSNFLKIPADASTDNPWGISGTLSVKDNINADTADNTMKNIRGENSTSKDDIFSVSSVLFFIWIALSLKEYSLSNPDTVDLCPPSKIDCKTNIIMCNLFDFIESL